MKYAGSNIHIHHHFLLHEISRIKHPIHHHFLLHEISRIKHPYSSPLPATGNKQDQTSIFITTACYMKSAGSNIHIHHHFLLHEISRIKRIHIHHHFLLHDISRIKHPYSSPLPAT
jgi:hypothetical protein